MRVKQNNMGVIVLVIGLLNIQKNNKNIEVAIP
jgi:hypothetical protein